MVIEYCLTAPAWTVLIPFAMLILLLLAFNRGWV